MIDMNLAAMQMAIDNNGEVLEALIAELGLAIPLRKRLDNQRYQKQLEACVQRVDAGAARRCDAGPFAVVFARDSDGSPLAINFDDLDEDDKKLFTGASVGSVVTTSKGAVVTIADVFDLRIVPTAPNGGHPAGKRGKGKRK